MHSFSNSGKYFALHALLFVYALSGLFSKNAAAQPFPSVPFFAFYFGMIAVLALFAFGWQQVLKRFPLTVAFANKAAVVVWGIIFGVLFFGEAITWQMVAGAVLIIVGIVLYSTSDKEASCDSNEDSEEI